VGGKGRDKKSETSNKQRYETVLPKMGKSVSNRIQINRGGPPKSLRTRALKFVSMAGHGATCGGWSLEEKRILAPHSLIGIKARGVKGGKTEREKEGESGKRNRDREDGRNLGEVH